jgi:hypothetical protein
MFKELEFPAGCELIRGWQNADADATARLKEIFDATLAGDYDALFHQPAPTHMVHASASLNLFVLSLLSRLYGLDSAQAYKGDAKRYVRTSLMIRRLLGLPKAYLEWPVYAFTAEVLGAVMLYPEGAPPGTDPGINLINRHTWNSITTPDFSQGIPKFFDEMMEFYQDVTGLEPVLHLTAPYSLAADIYGQEPLVGALTNETEFVNEMLDHLVDKVLQPWCDHFFRKFPKGWVELSDASGSPFFIGPEKCKNVAIRSILRLKNENPWGLRVYDANYRGDYVTEAFKVERASRRKKVVKKESTNLTFAELFDTKQSVCTDYVMRLHDDRLDLKLYHDRAMERNVPLFIGIGASQIDRNSIADLDVTKAEIQELITEYVASVKAVAHHIAAQGYENRIPPWPGAIYFEDVSAETSMDLMEIIVGTVLRDGQLDWGLRAGSL